MNNIQTTIPIIQLIDGFAIAEQSGGAALFALNLARFLRDAKLVTTRGTVQFRPIVCALWQHNAPSEAYWRNQTEAAGITTAILVSERGNLEADMVRAHRRLCQLSRQEGVQALNSHFERCDLLALTAKAAHGGRLKIVRTVHAERQWLSRPWLGTLLDLLAYPWFFDAEVAIAQGTYEMLAQRPVTRWCRRPAQRIYNGLNPDFIGQLNALQIEKGIETSTQHSSLQSEQPIEQSRTTSQTDGPHLIIVGRLEEQKGHATLIAAMPIVLRQLPTATVTIVGAGTLYGELMAQSKALGVEQSIHFLSGRDDVPALLRQSDIFVSSSNWEGFPTVILEAMAAQLPVVATDVGGSRELVRNGETGYLVPPRDPEALATAIVQLWTDRQTANKMAATAQQAIQPYLFPNIAAQYSRLYGQILGLNGPISRG